MENDTFKYLNTLSFQPKRKEPEFHIKPMKRSILEGTYAY